MKHFFHEFKQKLAFRCIFYIFLCTSLWKHLLLVLNKVQAYVATIGSKTTEQEKTRQLFFPRVQQNRNQMGVEPPTSHHSRVRAYSLFACLLSDWAPATDRLLCPTTCLPHEDMDVSLSALPKDTTGKLSGFSPHCPFRVKRRAGMPRVPFSSLRHNVTRELNPDLPIAKRTL